MTTCTSPEEAASARTAIDAVEQATLTAGWDGAWFRRAYDAFGAPVGSRECDEGQDLHRTPGHVRDGRDRPRDRSGRSRTEERGGAAGHPVRRGTAPARLHAPTGSNLGEISSYPPGYKENAGIFCHNNPWISCAETVLGHGDRAFAGLQQDLPGLYRGHQRDPPHRALRLQPDGRRPAMPPPSARPRTAG